HRGAMARGEESLWLELARRAGEGRRTPPPPAPTDWRTFLWPAGVALAAVAAIVILFRRSAG
ncbi:MAG TPA: hypothetical protein VK879_08770, partial [Candidatus Sulfomarinibacteraceae bacterium]|nr:hypothetical protein [Candidatus Sulfomarinibacteraceae bacterium]